MISVHLTVWMTVSLGIYVQELKTMTEKFATLKPVHSPVSTTVTTGHIWIRCQSLRTASMFQRHQQSGMRFHIIIAPSSNLLGLTYRLTHYPWPAVRPPPIFQLKTMSVSTCLDMLKKTSPKSLKAHTQI